MRLVVALLLLIGAILAPLEITIEWKAPEAQIACSGYSETVMSPVAGFQTLTVSSTAVALTVPATARLAVLTILTDNIRYRDDGTNPTATVGMLVVAGSDIVVCGGPSLGAFRMIRQTTDATVSVSYYGVR